MRRYMTKKEIGELLQLNGWTQAELARQVGLTEGAVSRWFTDRTPSGAATKAMRRMLDEARDRKRPEPVPA